jgi:hypothetical protein
VIPVVRGVECPLLESTADWSFGLRQRIAVEFATARGSETRRWNGWICGISCSLRGGIV